MPTSPPNEPTAHGGPAPLWLSVVDAAAALGITARAVQKRADRGTLPARRVKHGRALRWEIDASSVPLDGRDGFAASGANGSQTLRKMGAKGSQDGREPGGENANFERESVRVMGAKGSQDVHAMGADSGAVAARDDGAAVPTDREPQAVSPTRREKEQQEEIRFLRSTIEQLQRDGAEVRAALRAALKLAAPTEAPQLTAGDATGAAAAPTPTEAPQSAGAASGASVGVVASSGAPETPQRATAPAKGTGAKAHGAPLTYGDIADALERDLKARGL